jgi:hypothetical protein
MNLLNRNLCFVVTYFKVAAMVLRLAYQLRTSPTTNTKMASFCNVGSEHVSDAVDLNSKVTLSPHLQFFNLQRRNCFDRKFDDNQPVDTYSGWSLNLVDG